MTRRTILAGVLTAALWTLAPTVPLAEEKSSCPPHSHEVVERDEEEGGTVRRCLCDEGWDEGTVVPPCKQKAGGKAPAPAKGGKPDKGGGKPEKGGKK